MTSSQAAAGILRELRALRVSKLVVVVVAVSSNRASTTTSNSDSDSKSSSSSGVQPQRECGECRNNA